jgi:hypothetical protein
MAAVLSVHQLWDAHFHGNSEIYSQACEEHHSQIKNYISRNQKYVAIEQFNAVFPILFSVPVLVVSMFWKHSG